MNFKSVVGYIVAAGSILYGILGVLLELLGKLPPEIDFDFAPALIAIVAIVIQTFGLQDEFDTGRKSLLDRLSAFFNNPYRALGLSIVFVALRGVVAIPTADPSLVLAAKMLLSLLAILKLEGAVVMAKSLRAMRYSARIS